MLGQTCTVGRTPESCCIAWEKSKSQHSLLSGTGSQPPGCPKCLIGLIFHSPLPIKRSRHALTARVANPRQDSEHDVSDKAKNSWADNAAPDSGQDESQAAAGLDWAKVQSLAALTGASTLAAVIVLQLSGKTDLPKLAYENVPDAVQEVLPEQLGGKQRNGPLQQFDVGALVQNAKGQGNKQKENFGLPFDPPKPKADLQQQQDKIKSERQINFEKTKQLKSAKNEQNRKEKEQRQKQKEREKDEAERKEKERKERERKEAEKRKKFRDQALMGGGIFGVSALTFGKWQLFASLGAVVFRTIGGPTLLSSVLRTPGYIIGRGVRVVEWDVSEHPEGPDGDLLSMKLRALTPDGIRIAIAKEYNLSNYREVRQVSHWVTNAKPYFFEPMRTAAAFKMLPDPAFVVWSRHPPTGRHTLPTRSDQAPTADTASQDPLAGIPADQVTAVMLKTISGVAAASRRATDSGQPKHSRADTGHQLGNGSSHNGSGNAAAGRDHASDAAEAEHQSRVAVQVNGQQQSSSGPASSCSPSCSQHSASHAAACDGGLSQTPPQFNSQNGSKSKSERQAKLESTGSGVGNHQSASSSPESAASATAVSDAEHQQRNPEATATHDGGDDTKQAAIAESRQETHATAKSNHDPAASSHADSSHSRQEVQVDSAWQQSHNSNGSANIGSRRKLPRDTEHSPQHQSVDDEVAGVLHDDAHSDRHPSQAKDPQVWHEATVLQAICGSPSVSAEAWGERLQLPSDFAAVSEAEEEALVLAVSTSGDYMLSLFRAYAPHNVLTFMQFARRRCLQS